jgi:hypothetical protein
MPMGIEDMQQIYCNRKNEQFAETGLLECMPVKQAVSKIRRQYLVLHGKQQYLGKKMHDKHTFHNNR